MRIPVRTSSPLPMVELNTTPLIDVLLVLLVMFIITIPIQTHAVRLDLPRPCPSCPQPNAVSNELRIEKSGQLLWDGVPATKDQLGYLLDRSQRFAPPPELHLRPDAEARYEAVDQVLAIIKREHVRKVGFVGNDAYAVH